MSEIKNIILLSDGTGNSAANPHKTNVWRLYKAINTSSDARQLVFYDNGVGTSSFTPLKLLGLAFGFGLRRNVLELYSDLCRVYNKGDKIFIFGYSRGAFTARFLSALICEQGIIKKFENERDLKKQVEEAFENFRCRNFKVAWLEWVFSSKRRKKINKQEPPASNSERYFGSEEPGDPLIEFLGVWDTVDAYGAPLDELTDAWDIVVYRLTAKDRNLSAKVGRAYHALALDEAREAFEPMLWNEAGETAAVESIDEERVTQVWFPGVHSNIGGGNPDDSLAYVSLNWMLKGAKTKGLKFHEQVLEEYERTENIYGPIPDNRSGMANIYRYAPRNVEVLSNDGPVKPNASSEEDKVVDEVRVEVPKVHHTVLNRIKHGGNGYAPIGMPKRYVVVDGKGKIIPQKNEALSEETFLLTETEEQAAQRRKLQGNVWVAVWRRKLVYLLTLFVVFIFLFYPYLYPIVFVRIFGEHFIASLADPLLGGISDVLRAIPSLIGKIPGLGFLDGWANDYKNHPYPFFFGFVAIVTLLYISEKIKFKIRDRMRTYWSHITHGDDKFLLDESGNSRFNYSKYFDSHVSISNNENKCNLSIFDKIERAYKTSITLITVLLLLIFILFSLSRVAYSIFDVTGAICRVSEEASQSITASGTKVHFDPKSFCFDAGVELEKGKRYKVIFEVAYWKDETINADVHGWVDEPPSWIYLFTPLLRHYSAAWYQPVARIGNTWFDRHIDVQPRAEEGVAELRKTYVFTAKSTGRLFLYMNDAVLTFWPFTYDFFYENNDGEALITISLEDVE